MRNTVTFAKLGRHGRLANAMYQIAGTIGIARKNGYDFAFPYWANYNGADFEPEIDIDVQKEFVNPLPHYDGPELPELGIPWGYHDVKLTRSVSLLGHFQSEKYFSHCLDEIKWYMTMKDEPRAIIDYVAIHVRLGDYGPQASPQNPDGNPYHPRMNMSYYGPAMAQFPGAKFLVFSDDIAECERMFGTTVEYARGSYFNDFRIMKRCRHFIIANSSFSAFAAILGDAPDKQVVAPYPWFGGPYTATLDPKDIYSPGWTVVDYQNGKLKQAA